jgi:hypothetical protein
MDPHKVNACPNHWLFLLCPLHGYWYVAKSVPVPGNTGTFYTVGFYTVTFYAVKVNTVIFHTKAKIYKVSLNGTNLIPVLLMSHQRPTIVVQIVRQFRIQIICKPLRIRVIKKITFQSEMEPSEPHSF